jgi:NADH-ubiquinone oxidoreductase complex I, 21 kDa subunit
MSTEAPTVEYFDAHFLDPKFPIVKADPCVDDVIKSMRTSDYLFISGSMAGTWVYGYILGKPIRGPTAAVCASVGFTFGMMYSMQTIRSRLLGYRANAPEVQKWGLAPVAQPQPYKVFDLRFPKRQNLSSESTKPKLNWDNYK